MTFAKTQQGLMRPGILVEDWYLDDTGLDDRLGHRAALSIASTSRNISSGLITSGSNLIWKEALAGRSR